ESAFITEVHHITGDGTDAGVVYSEMESKDKSKEVGATLMRSMYPESSGYHYISGGHPKNLRENTTNHKIREFHRKFYRPENLHLIICGQIKAHNIFETLESIESKIISKNTTTYEPFTRPWSSNIPPLIKNIERIVELPSEQDDDKGDVYMAWRGPAPGIDVEELVGFQILLDSLMSSALSPIRKAFRRILESPPMGMSSDLPAYKESMIFLKIHGIPQESFNEAIDILMNTLKNITEDKQNFDLHTLKNVIKKFILNGENYLENTPHEGIAKEIITVSLHSK
ncbi:unnamed protein product, partial [Meganyctiphanes norvegica]